MTILKTFPTVSAKDNWVQDNVMKCLNYRASTGVWKGYDGTEWQLLVCRTIHDAHRVQGFEFERAEFHAGLPADCRQWLMGRIREPLL